MNEKSLNIGHLSGLPKEWDRDLIPEIRRRIASSERKIVVLDDDPTGTQTVYGVRVLTDWSTQSLEGELASDARMFFILTNSRSLTLSASQSLHREVGANLRAVSEKIGIKMEVVSRSDSTLRGHFPGEIDALVDVLGYRSPPYLLIPFFLEGGRFTFDDVHYVAEGDRLVPAAQTPYARDVVFPYRSSNLREWVEDRTGGRIPAAGVASVSLEILRRGNVQQVVSILASLEPGSACIVNAASYRDLEVFVLGLIEAEDRGLVFLPRTAASFIRARAGLPARPLLKRSDLIENNSHGGLFMVGSHVPKTTAQLESLLKQTSIRSVEVSVDKLLDGNARGGVISAVAETVNAGLRAGSDVVVYTSRGLLKGTGQQSSVSIGQLVSDGLVSILQAVEYQPRYLVAKGGNTSSELATKALRVRRPLAIGQVLPGVPVWELDSGSRYPGMRYIIFPGNVGDQEALVKIQKLLSFDQKGQ